MSEDNKNFDEESGFKAFLTHPRKKQMIVLTAVFAALFLGTLICVAVFVKPASAKKSSSNETAAQPSPEATKAAEDEQKESAPKSNIPKKTSQNNKSSLDVTLVPGYVFPDDSIGNPNYKPTQAVTTPAGTVTKKPVPTKAADPTPMPTKAADPTPVPTVIDASPTPVDVITPEPTVADITPEPTTEPVETVTPEPTQPAEITPEPTAEPVITKEAVNENP